MQTKRSTAHVLGVMVTDREVQAVLLQEGADGVKLMRRFTRQRSNHAGSPSGVALGMPQFQEENANADDFTIQFGGGAGGSELFLGSEFSGLTAGAEQGEGGTGGAATPSFELELGDILSECRDAGYVDLSVAFCLGSIDTTHVELRVAEVKRKKGLGAKKEDASHSGRGESKPRPVAKAQLLEQLAGQHEGVVDPECVAFVPMTPSEEGMVRYLALLPKPSDPVASTLRIMREDRASRLPSIRLLDSEASLYLGLARAAQRVDEEHKADDDETHVQPKEFGQAPQNTLVVRVGAEDTIVLIVQGEALQHYEHLRSLTAYDSPETICSRVLLQQDAHNVGEARRILLASEEREAELVQNFEMFFPDARVELLQNYLPKPDGDKPIDAASSTTVAAAGVALRLVNAEAYKTVFEDTNLLPRQLMRRRLHLPITWHGLVMAALLFCTVLFFMARYFSMEHEINEYRLLLKQYPPELKSTDVRVLQTRIDSLQTVYSGYMRALNVLDTLLVGSDAWSRALEQISKETAAVRGIWIETWRPEDTKITVSGTSTARERVVGFAERTNGVIQKLTFSEIRDWPVYSFSMSIPLRIKLPEAAEYLRARAKAEEEAASEAASEMQTTTAGKAARAGNVITQP